MNDYDTKGLLSAVAAELADIRAGVDEAGGLVSELLRLAPPEQRLAGRGGGRGGGGPAGWWWRPRVRAPAAPTVACPKDQWGCAPFFFPQEIQTIE